MPDTQILRAPAPDDNPDLTPDVHVTTPVAIRYGDPIPPTPTEAELHNQALAIRRVFLQRRRAQATLQQLVRMTATSLTTPVRRERGHRVVHAGGGDDGDGDGDPDPEPHHAPATETVRGFFHVQNSVQP
jgi:hypothetical protein